MTYWSIVAPLSSANNALADRSLKRLAPMVITVLRGRASDRSQPTLGKFRAAAVNSGKSGTLSDAHGPRADQRFRPARERFYGERTATGARN
jgi:hypothetical protein